MQADLEWDVAPAELSEAFADLEAALDSEFEAAAADSGARLRSAAQTRVNVDTSRLQSSIEEEVQRVGLAVWRVAVGSNVEYAAAVELGITAFVHEQEDVMVFESGGETVFTHRIDHPGTSGHPYLKPALDAELGNIVDRFIEAIENALESVGLAS